MTFDMPGNITVAGIGEKTVIVKTTRHEKTHFTVVLSCLADGTKLCPVLIFKRKTLPRNLKLPPGITVRVPPKGWMYEEGTKRWLLDVWGRRPRAGIRKCPSLLVWDMFRAHKTEGVKAEARRMAVIPGGLTSTLQPLDVSLNKPFKQNVRKM